MSCFATKITCFIFSLVSFLGFANILRAQTTDTKVLLQGKIINVTNEGIPNATIHVNPGSKVYTSNAEGSFSIPLSSGTTYTLEISSVGYQTKKVNDVTITTNTNDYLIVTLDYTQKNTMETVVVTASGNGKRIENTAALLTLQRNNPSLSSGISADYIRRTPDKNTGEVLKRVSGASIQDNKFVIVRGMADRYNSAYINGAMMSSSEPDKKAFSFDVIPSALIDGIVINKTATPEFTGEFSGGLVQVKTKDIPSKSELTVGIGLGFNTQSVFKDFFSNKRGKTDWLGFSDDKLPASYPKKYGEYNTLNNDQKTAIAQSFPDDVYAVHKTTALPILQANLVWTNIVKGKKGSQFGIVTALNYRSQKLLTNVSRTMKGQKDDNEYVFDYIDAQNKYTVNVGAIANIAWAYKKNKIAFKNLFNQLFDNLYYSRSGTNVDNNTDVKLRSSVPNQRSLYSGQLEGFHVLPWNNMKLDWNINGAYNYKTQPDLRVQSYTRPINSNNNVPYSLNNRGVNTNRFYSYLKDGTFGFNAALTVPFNLSNQKQQLKIGGGNTTKLRDFNAYIFGYADPNNTALMTARYDSIFLKKNFGGNGFYMTTDLQNPEDKYFGVSSVSSGFLQINNTFSEKVKLIWGLRGEYFEQVLYNKTHGTDKAQVRDVNELNLLPSANLNFNLNKKNSLRLAYSNTIARPEFREVASFAYFDFEQLASISGNPNLKTTTISNYDIRYEYYPKGGEIISAGIFYKTLKNAIEVVLDEGSNVSRRAYVYKNAPKGTVSGIEIEFRKSLGFIAQNESTFWNNLILTGNASFIKSKVEITDTTQAGEKVTISRPLQGQSPYLINIGLGYDDVEKGLGLSLVYNRIGDRLSLVGNKTIADNNEKGRDLVDIQLYKKLMKKQAELRLTIGDLLSQNVAVYQNFGSDLKYNTGDNYFSKYKPGTTFTLSFNYTFNLKNK